MCITKLYCMQFALLKLSQLFPPEFAHNAALFAIKHNLVSVANPLPPAAILGNTVLGLRFKHPVCLAAGFDKNAFCIEELSKLGFSGIELGTVTDNPQSGNPKPRVFRLSEDQAIINKLGMPNYGIKHFIGNLMMQEPLHSCIIGGNIASNTDSEEPIQDYINVFKRLYKHVNYITLNVSCPNVKHFQQMQSIEWVTTLVSELRQSINKEYKIPIVLKISPDSDNDFQEAIADLATRREISGLIISNTTNSRQNLKNKKHIHENGGLSGKPLFDLSTELLERMFKLTKGKVPLIGCGGILSADDAYRKILSGASILQIYSGFVYKGFSLINEINTKLTESLQKDGFKSITHAVGANV